MVHRQGYYVATDQNFRLPMTSGSRHSALQRTKRSLAVYGCWTLVHSLHVAVVGGRNGVSGPREECWALLAYSTIALMTKPLGNSGLCDVETCGLRKFVPWRIISAKLEEDVETLEIKQQWFREWKSKTSWKPSQSAELLRQNVSWGRWRFVAGEFKGW